MDVGRVIGAILLGIGKVISTPAVAKTAERVVEAAVDPRVKPISEDEARVTRTLWRASVTFPKGRTSIRSTPDTFTADLPDQSLLLVFRCEQQSLFKKDQLSILREKGRLAAGERLDMVRGYPSVLIRREFDQYVVHEMYVLVKEYIFVLVAQVKKRDEKRHAAELESFFSSFRVN